MVCNTAVFYDIENLVCLFSVKTSTILRLDEIYRRILEQECVSGVSIQKAYADWAVQINRNLRSNVLQIGIEPVQIFNTNQNDRVKNAADVSLIIDAVELIAKNPEVENYVIVSGDGIFAFLAKKLHEHGKRVIGCGFDANTNIIFRNACDLFVSLEKNDKALVNGSRAAAQQPAAAAAPTAPLAMNPPVPSPVKTAPPAKAAPAEPAPVTVPPGRFPRSKFTNALSGALADGRVHVWKNTSDPNGALLVMRDLVLALFGEGVDETDDMEISVFKTYLDFFVPGFKISHYKAKKYFDVVRLLLTNSPFCLYTTTADGTTIKIARRGMVGDKGNTVEDLYSLAISLPDGTAANTFFNVPEHSAYAYSITESPKAPPAQSPQPAVQAASLPAAQAVPSAPQAGSRGGRRKNQARAADTAPERAASAVLPEPQAPASPAAATPKAPAGPDEPPADGTIRPWIKECFMRLSREDLLPAAEARRMTTAEYSQKTFGIRTPILKEIVSRSGLTEARTVNGKVKYWKDSFKYHNKTYLVYKEWIAALHRDRFTAWLTATEERAEKEKAAADAQN